MQLLIIIGNVGNDPEIKYIKDGIAVCNLSVAVASREGGETKTTWYSVTTWRKTAEAVANYAKKGNKIMVQGTPGLEIYDGRDGKTHAKLTINATEVEFLTPKDPTTTEQPTNTYTPTANNTQDIPF